MKKISRKQQEIFDFIKSFIDEVGTPPSVREIGNAVGLSSSSTVQYHINALVEMGYLERGDANMKRSLRIAKTGSTYHVPLLGTVTAGKPILAVESIEDYIPVPVSSKSAELFALRVRGDSMINAAICNGDIVIVERSENAKYGDIVVAMDEENQVTIKRYFREKDYIRLQPENDYMLPIILKEATILGKAVGLYRKF